MAFDYIVVGTGSAECVLTNTGTARLRIDKQAQLGNGPVSLVIHALRTGGMDALSSERRPTLCATAKKGGSGGMFEPGSPCRADRPR